VSPADSSLSRLPRPPWPVVMEGESGDNLKFLYLDARDLLGH
jgi:hypothetical protein